MSFHDILRGDVIPLSGVAVAIGRNSFDPPSPVVPVFDIHQRTAVLHDSGAPVHSGVVSFNSDENRLELIPSNSGAQPIVTAVLWDGYDNTGGTTVGASNVTVAIDTERVNTHPDVFVFDGTEPNHVQINMPGTYEFEYSVTLDASTTTRSSCRIWLRRLNPGASFGEVTGSRSFTYNRTTAAGEDTGNAKIILENIVAGTVFGLRAIRIAGGNCVTVADGSRLTIRKLA
jgi:hypothetical protein